MPETRKCPECGAPLPGDSPGGVCVVCGLRGALDASSDPAAATPEQPVEKADPTAKSELSSEKSGDKIGRYRLLQEIGVGGMGSVWMAEQQQPHRRVALKLVKLGMDTKQVLARFSAEQQALALMDHPNIAKVFEAGSTDNGRPYFVMELVRGIPITTYCDKEKLSTGERLELFVQVCQAIQHAHQKGVIHRDIKPSNILVTRLDGVAVPKVIDFGIAKATQGKLVDETLFTAFEQFLGTPAYMSPEQAELNALDIDTRSDIYSLGVLLYELLSGRTPFDAKKLLEAGLDEIRRVIRDVDPPRPSTRLSTLEAEEQTAVARQRRSEAPKLLGLIRGDLDWIVMKALDKDRSRRYETANGLAADIRRHLQNEPVTACPPSKVYRLQKLVRRNKLAFGLGSGVAVSLAVGLIALAALFLREKAARRTQTRLRQAAEAAEKSALAQTERAEAASTETRLTLATSDFSQAVGLIEAGHRSDALAYLVRSLASNPTNAAALTRLATLLAYHSWTVPTFVFKHEGPVSSAEFSPDGKRIVTASDDGTARVWDAQTGRPMTEPLKHKEIVKSAQFSPDGKRIVTASDDGTARVWDAQTGRPVMAAFQHESGVSGAEFSPDGKRLVTTSSPNVAQESFARVWDAETGHPLTAPMKHKAFVAAAGFSPDGKRIVTGSWDHTAQVWDAQTGQPLLGPLRHKGRVAAAQFSPEGKRIVTSSWDSTAQVWDAQTGQPLVEPLRHKDRVTYAEFSPEGKRIVTASGDRTARVWDAQTGRALTEPLKHNAWVTSAQFSPDGKWVIVVSTDSSARVWDAQSGQPMGEPLKHKGRLVLARFGPDGKRIVTASVDGTARVWDVQSGPPIAEPLAHRDRVWSAQFSPDGRRVVTGSWDHTARVWDAGSGRPLTEPMNHSDRVVLAQFSPDGKKIVTASRDRTARIWDAQGGQPLTEPLKHNGGVESAQFSRDGKWIVTASQDSTARVWDGQTGQALGAPLRHQGPVNSAQFSPDGKRVVTASADRTARVWDAQTGQPVTAPLKHEINVFSAGVWDAQFSPDGKRVATAPSDLTARVWDAQTGQLLLAPLMHGDWVWSAQYSADGKRILTFSSDSTARVWDAQTGQPLIEPLRHRGAVSSAQFSPDQKQIVTSSWDDTARVWDTQTGQPLTESFRHKAGVNSAQFNPDGRRIVTASADNTARVWDIVSASPRCPEWLLRLSEAISGQVLSSLGVMKETKLNRGEVIGQIRDELSREPDDDDRVVWGRWFLADPATRTISPYSKLTVREYIENRIKENTPASLAEAEDLASGNAGLLQRIAQFRALLAPAPAAVPPAAGAPPAAPPQRP